MKHLLFQKPIPLNDAYSIVAIDENNKIITKIKKTKPTMEFVDLGLPSGTLWGKYNIGATKPEEY